MFVVRHFGQGGSESNHPTPVAGVFRSGWWAARKDDSVITEIGDIDKLPDDDNAGADDLKEMIYRERNK